MTIRLPAPFARTGCLLAMVAALSLPAVSFAVEISQAQAGNVTPFSFTLVWRTSAPAEAGLSVYADSEGAVEVTGQLRFEAYPLNMGDRAVSSDYQGRIGRRALTDEIKGRHMAMVRVSGLAPGATYYARPKALDADGAEITTGGPVPLVAVATAVENAFVSESRQLVLDFSPANPSLSHGAIARVSAPGLPYPLFSVVGDGPVSTEAFCNLDNLLDAAGLANLDPQEPLDLRISLLGMGAREGVMDYTVPFSGGFVTAASMILPFSPFSVVVDSFAFDPVPDQEVGRPFTVTIRALDSSGEVIAAFSGTADVAANLALASGGGRTAAFSEGRLAGHELAFSEPGGAQLSATETGGTATGQSNVFNVAGVTWTLSVNAVPGASGTVTGGGAYLQGTLAAIEAVPADNFLFDGWIGEGVDDLTAPLTSVLMTADRFVTAVFVEDPVIEDYAEWKRRSFLRAAGDPVLTAPDYDFDLDGLPNILEYAFGTDPLRPDRGAGAPYLAMDESGDPQFTFIRRASATDLDYTILISSALDGGWAPHDPEPGDVTVVDLGDGMERVSVRLAAPAGSRNFVRLNVTIVTP